MCALEVIVKTLLFALSPIYNYCLALKSNYVSALEVPKLSRGEKRCHNCYFDKRDLFVLTGNSLFKMS